MRTYECRLVIGSWVGSWNQEVSKLSIYVYRWLANIAKKCSYFWSVQVFLFLSKIQVLFKKLVGNPGWTFWQPISMAVAKYWIYLDSCILEIPFIINLQQLFRISLLLHPKQSIFLLAYTIWLLMKLSKFSKTNSGLSM